MNNKLQKKSAKLSKNQGNILSVFSKAQTDLEAHLIEQENFIAEVEQEIKEQQELLVTTNKEIENGSKVLENLKLFLGGGLG